MGFGGLVEGRGGGRRTFVEFLESGILRCETAFTRCVDYEDYFAFQVVEGVFVAFFVFGLELPEGLGLGHACEVSREIDAWVVQWEGLLDQERSRCFKDEGEA